MKEKREEELRRQHVNKERKKGERRCDLRNKKGAQEFIIIMTKARDAFKRGVKERKKKKKEVAFYLGINIKGEKKRGKHVSLFFLSQKKKERKSSP